MATIGGGAVSQQALERGGQNPLGSALPYGNGTTPIELGLGAQGPTPILIDAFTVSILVALNGGTISAGTFSVDVSNDGVNWTDSGVTPVNVPTTDGGYQIIAVSKYNAASKMPVRYARAKIASAASTGAPTVSLALAA